MSGDARRNLSVVHVQVAREKIHCWKPLTLADGVVLDQSAIGMRVVALGNSYWGRYKEGYEGTITQLRPTDPVVR